MRDVHSSELLHPFLEPPLPVSARISWVLVALLWVWAWLTWANAPDQVPLHFGFSGEPTRWGPRSLVSWFGPAVAATLLTAGMGWLTRWTSERPDLINLPGKQRLQQLPPRYHGPVRDVVKKIIGWATLETVALVSLVQWATIRAAAGEDARVVIGLVFAVALIASPILIASMFAASQRAFDEAFRQAKSEGSIG